MLRQLVTLVGLACASAGAVAASSTELSGYFTPANVGGGFGPGSSCSYSNNGINVISGACIASGMAGNDSASVSTHGFSTASSDGGGLHGAVLSEIELQGTYTLIQYTLTSSAGAFATFDDVLRFDASAPPVGMVQLTYTAVGSASAGGSAVFELLVADLGGSNASSSCQDLPVVSGISTATSCSVSMAAHFQAGVHITELMTLTARAVVGGGNGTSAQAGASFDDTAYVSAISFTDLAGNPLSLHYTADSGYTYPMTDAVPEPASLSLMLGGLVLLAVRSRRRR